jgi:molybdopterin/thiamine biosynthesis adenylyltransferase
VFTDALWENLDVVVNALDNVTAILYIESRCLYFQKPLLESRTLGAKCNTHMASLSLQRTMRRQGIHLKSKHLCVLYIHFLTILIIV